MASTSLCAKCSQIPFAALRNPATSEVADLVAGRFPNDRFPFKTDYDYVERRVNLGLLSGILGNVDECGLCMLIWQVVARRGCFDEEGRSFEGEDVSLDIKINRYGRYSAAGLNADNEAIVRRLSITAMVGDRELPRYPEDYYDDCFQACDVGSGSVLVDASFRDPRSSVDQMVLGGRKRPLVVDMDWLRGWIKICDTEQSHKACHLSQDINEQFLVPAVRMIDVRRKCIVTFNAVYLHHIKYAALSYVWGPSQKLTVTRSNIADLHKPGALEDHLVALSIADARLLAQNLDIEYLWVDALCIIQDSDDDKAVQIGNMDAIYSAAYLTIVAAAGVDASSGLPGLRPGTRSYLQQEVVVIDPDPSQPGFVAGMSLLTSIYSEVIRGDHYTGKTVWNQRGWTMQERALARRVLIFTSEQVYWACPEATFCEESYFELPQPRFRFFASGANELTLERTFRNYGESSDPQQRFWRQYHEIVRRYTRRHFSFEGDVNDAFAAIVKSLARSSAERFHWGVPRSRFEIGVAWTTFTGQSRRTALSTLPMTSKKERVKFPSWSWMGWIGEASLTVDDERYETEMPQIACYAHKGSPLTIERISPPNYNDAPVTMSHIAQYLPGLTAEKLSDYPDEHIIFFWTFTAEFAVRGGNQNSMYLSTSSFGKPSILDAAGKIVGSTCQMLDAHWESGGYDDGTHEFALIARRSIPDIPDISPVALVLQLKRNEDGTVERVNIGEIEEEAWLAAEPRRNLIALV